MIVLDLWGDRHPVWQAREAFFGKPWVWNVLYNFGGKTSLNGDLPSIASNLAAALRSPDKGRLSGLGMMMEGLGTNPIVPDFVMDMAWRDDVPSVHAWTRDYVVRRYGVENAKAWDAWQILLDTVYRSPAQTGTFLVSGRSFTIRGRRTEVSQCGSTTPADCRLRSIRCWPRRGISAAMTPIATTW